MAAAELHFVMEHNKPVPIPKFDYTPSNDVLDISHNLGRSVPDERINELIDTSVYLEDLLPLDKEKLFV
ncbi:hypothetical protein AsGV041 [Agrotis segetum granulovirus]|uniref:Uncharacterized protein n=1 Tax=Agrotis segetum granulosis virus TaxID=10464 RepID=A0A023MI69_GVAS|nr:hypothetical protein AsGV041 [Agrotis segetum granulovirus]AHN92080.1 hypothetical protein AsGV041 [Agrotis segetum granulovirus]AKN63315.1 hypothetical protein AsGV041 [Agrotis segetum granulovirus]